MYLDDNALITEMLTKSRAMQRDDPMSREVELALVAAAQNGCEKSMTRLVEYHSLFVMSVALQHRKHYEIEDCFVAGLAGLVVAVGKFDASQGAGLLSYARWWISQRIRYEIYNNFNPIRFPIHAVGAVFEFRKNGCAPMPDMDKARRTKTQRRISEATMRSIFDASRPVWSLDQPLHSSGDDGDEILLVDTMTAPDDETAEASSDIGYLNRVMAEVLTERERFVIVQYVAEGRTLDDIGIEVGVTRERIRQIKNKALEKMRVRMAIHERQCRSRRAGLTPLATKKAQGEPCPS